jgi:hypothetical protein
MPFRCTNQRHDMETLKYAQKTAHESFIAIGIWAQKRYGGCCYWCIVIYIQAVIPDVALKFACPHKNWKYPKNFMRDKTLLKTIQVRTHLVVVVQDPKHCNVTFPYFILFFNAFILWNNEAVAYYCNLWHVVFHVLHVPRPQDARTPSKITRLGSKY